MKHVLMIFSLLVLCGGILWGGTDRKKEKMAEPRVSFAKTSFSPATILSTNGWAEFDIESATSRYKGIDILPGGVIWVAGADEGFTTFYGFRSVNGGSTWTKFTINTPTAPATGGVTNIAGVDSNIAVIGTDSGYLLRTTNGGAQWDPVCTYAPTGTPWMDGVMCVGSTRDTLIAFGDADVEGVPVFRSIDKGGTWTRLTNLPATDSVLSDTWYAGYYTYGQCMDVLGNTVWIALYYGGGWDPRILKSTDRGDTWTVFAAPLPAGNAYDTYIRTINFKDENIGYGVIKGLSSSSTFWLSKTTDGGHTWSDTINVEPGVTHSDAKPVFAKPIRGTNYVFAGGWGLNGAKAWWSTDEGATWTNLNFPLGPNTNAEIDNAAFIDAGHGWAIGRGLNLQLDPASAVEQQPSGRPVVFTLSQNYPNPFNPTTTIAYTVPRSGAVELKVFDLLGREVATLADGMHNAATYTVVFDAKNLSSGIYFYRLSAGDVVITKSLLLLK